MLAPWGEGETEVSAPRVPAGQVNGLGVEDCLYDRVDIGQHLSIGEPNHHESALLEVSVSNLVDGYLCWCVVVLPIDLHHHLPLGPIEVRYVTEHWRLAFEPEAGRTED